MTKKSSLDNAKALDEAIFIPITPKDTIETIIIRFLTELHELKIIYLKKDDIPYVKYKIYADIMPFIRHINQREHFNTEEGT